MVEEKGENVNIPDMVEGEAKDPRPLDSEVIEGLPPEVREFVRVGMMSMQHNGPLPNPLIEKINEGHIDRIIDLAEKDGNLNYKDAGRSKCYTLVYTLIAVAVFVFVTVFLAKTNQELFKEILKLFAVFIGGLGSGFGLKGYMDRGR